MPTLFVIIMWISAYGTCQTTANVDEVRNIPRYGCYIADFGKYYMDNSMRRILEATERYSAAQNAALYAKHISNRSKRLYRKIPDMLSARKFRPAAIVERIHKWHVSLVGSNINFESCEVDSIAKEMHDYNIERAVGPDACIVGTNLRKIYHLYTLVLQGRLEHTRKILHFFLPELSVCWDSTPANAPDIPEVIRIFDVKYLQEFIYEMLRVANDLKVRQNVEYFEMTKLTWRHVVQYVPTNELERTEEGHFKITAAFHWLMKFIEEKSMNKRGTFHVEKGNGAQVRSLLFAVVANAEYVESYFPLYDANDGELRSYIAEQVMKRLIEILAVPFDEAAKEIVTNPNPDYTRGFLLLIHNGHHGQFYLESMLVEFVRLGIKISKNSGRNGATIENICETPLSAMFHVQATLQGSEDRYTAAKFLEKLVTYFDESAISKHFNKHPKVGTLKKTLWSRIKSPMNRRRVSSSNKEDRVPLITIDSPATITVSKFSDDSDNNNKLNVGKLIGNGPNDVSAHENYGEEIPLNSSFDVASADHKESQLDLYPLRDEVSPELTS